jgi:hypothetical protein
MMSGPIARRHFLRSSSALIALPFLESLGFRRFASAASTRAASARPKRLVFLGFGWGVTRETWFPDSSKKGTDWSLPPGLAPLEQHRRDLTVIQGLSNRFSNEAHWGSTFWLTGANRYAQPGQSFHNTISVDQVAAEVLGKNNRFPSLQLSCEQREESGHGPGLSLAWNRQGKPMPGLTQPTLAFHKLFSDESTPLAQRQAELRQKRSVLDTVRLDAKSVASRLIRSDVDKLDEYLQSIREIETRLSLEEQWLDKPKAKPAEPITLPKKTLEGFEEIDLMYRLLVAALQTDTTRVVTYQQPVESLLKSLDIGFTGHNVSHYSPGPRMEASQLRDRKQSELLARLLDRLKAARESDGSSLFDHTTVVYGSNIQSAHYLDNCPTLVAGRGAGFHLGHHVSLPGKTPLCNLWLTLLRGSGVEAASHGDSTGVLSQLLA